MSGRNFGWIKLHRQFIDSAIWRDFALMRFWVWCLLKATHEPITVTVGHCKVTLQPGQFIFTRSMACMETGLSEKVVRTCLDALGHEMDPCLGRERARRFSVITILNWDSYQIGESAKGREKSVKGPRNGPSTINKEDKKLKKNKGADGTATPIESPTWMQWADACRAVGRKDPAPSDGALKAAETLAEWVPDLDEQRRIMDAFLTIDNGYLKRQGYQLANLTKYKFEEARAIADGAVKTGVASASDDYELTGDSLAAAIECANLFGRAANE